MKNILYYITVSIAISYWEMIPTPPVNWMSFKTEHFLNIDMDTIRLSTYFYNYNCFIGNKLFSVPTSFTTK
jgi:hypothetical protein